MTGASLICEGQPASKLVLMNRTHQGLDPRDLLEIIIIISMQTWEIWVADYCLPETPLMLHRMVLRGDHYGAQKAARKEALKRPHMHEFPLPIQVDIIQC